jgi:hypothetical protein
MVDGPASYIMRIRRTAGNEPSYLSGRGAAFPGHRTGYDSNRREPTGADAAAIHA